MEMHEIETPRLLLRPLRASDAADVLALLGDPGVFRFMMDGAPPSAAFVRDLIASSALGFDEVGLGAFRANLRGSGDLVGLVGFRPAEIGGFELLCALIPRFWGQGLAEEACRASIAFAFERTDLENVLAAADAPNASSLRLIARLGFERVCETPGAFGSILWFARRR
jgi:ribosomal-protein-alanine N-acetyltransferase